MAAFPYTASMLCEVINCVSTALPRPPNSARSLQLSQPKLGELGTTGLLDWQPAVRVVLRHFYAKEGAIQIQAKSPERPLVAEAELLPRSRSG